MKFLLKIMTFVLLVFVMFYAGKYFLVHTIYVKEYTKTISEISKKYEVDENLIYAMIKVESNFNENAVSSAGAKGLMQVMDGTADEVSEKIGIKNYSTDMLLNPSVNIEIGVKYYSELYDKYGKTELALMAYNAGQGNVDKWISEGIITEKQTYYMLPYKETTSYWQKVLREYKIYNYLYSNT